LDQSSRPAAAAVDGVVVVEIVAGGGAVAGEPADVEDGTVVAVVDNVVAPLIVADHSV